MTTVIHVVWIIIPLFFFAIALYAKLEMIGNKHKVDNPKDFLRQAAFTTLCTGIAFIIDEYALEGLVQSLSPDWIPVMFYRILLLPLILVIGAHLAGGSEEIAINKAPRPTERPKRRR